MKIIIRESQYNILVNKPRDVVFGKINEGKGRKPKYSPEEENNEIERILDYVRGGGEIKYNHPYYGWLNSNYHRTKSKKFKNALDQIKEIQTEFETEFENNEIERILDYVRSGGIFTRGNNMNKKYVWLFNRAKKDKTGKFKNALDQINEIRIEIENKEIERIINNVKNSGDFTKKDWDWLYSRTESDKTGKFKNVLEQIKQIKFELYNEKMNNKIEKIINHIKNGGEFIRDKTKDPYYSWLASKIQKDKTGKYKNVLDQITEIQTELGIKKEWWGEKTIKDILEEMKFNGVTPRHKYKECKNSLTCRQYEFDIYLPYNENNTKINKNIPENGIIFEYDGIQHFEFKPYFHKTEEKFNSQIFRDKEKNLYCKNNNIKLVRIPYTSKTITDIKNDIELALKDPGTFILTGDYPKLGWNK